MLVSTSEGCVLLIPKSAILASCRVVIQTCHGQIIHNCCKYLFTFHIYEFLNFLKNCVYYTFVGGYTDWKNVHGMNNIKFAYGGVKGMA